MVENILEINATHFTWIALASSIYNSFLSLSCGNMDSLQEACEADTGHAI